MTEKETAGFLMTAKNKIFVTAAAASVILVLSLIFICGTGVFAADSGTLSAASDTILAGLLSSESEIDIAEYNLSADELRGIVSKLIETHPELYYVSTAYTYTYDDEDVNRTITSMTPTYTLSGAELAAAGAVVDELISDIISGVTSNMTTVEKLLVIHDYLLLNYSYDSSVTNYNLYLLATKGSGTCVAYSLAVKAACDKLGIECSFATSESMNHEWNVVKIGSYWYHMDVAWDDVVPDMPGRALHNSFLKSDSAIVTATTTEHTGWECDYSCDSTLYDSYVWDSVTSPFVYVGGSWYSVDASEKELRIYDFSAGTSSAVASISEKWQVSGSTNVYTLAYSGVGTYGGCVYYNDPTTIYSYNVSTGVSNEVISPDVGSYSIYYFTISESGTLTYYLSDSPNKSYSSYGTVALSEISATYTITYMVGGEVYATDTYSEGDTITPPEDPTSDSGTFSRWESLPETMPANDITVTAIFTSAECDHSETTLYTITAATCTTDGEAEIICSLCGEILGYQTIPASHTEGEWEIVTAATCTATGERVKKCTVCGATLETEVIAMTAHTYGDWEVVDGETVHVCTVCGYTETYAAASETEGVTGTADGTADDTAGGTSSDTGDADDGTSRGVSAAAVIIYIIVLIVVGCALGAVIYFAVKMDKKKQATDSSHDALIPPNSKSSSTQSRETAHSTGGAASDETVVFDKVSYLNGVQGAQNEDTANYSDSQSANRKVASTAKPYSGARSEGTAASGAQNEDTPSKTTSSSTSSTSTTTSSSTSETIFDDWTDAER
ncbi:MAG: hypothetical protein LUD44_05285 [Firmicutes bacterium]|nr:hypothetical protein [Bacillota bacterium]